MLAVIAMTVTLGHQQKNPNPLGETLDIDVRANAQGEAAANERSYLSRRHLHAAKSIAERLDREVTNEAEHPVLRGRIGARKRRNLPHERQPGSGAHLSTHLAQKR